MLRRYNDINHVHALLEGEGWHITGRSPNKTSKPTGKDRRRCKHYDKDNKGCKRLNYSPCIGVRKCPTYREK